jgi:hypothetical protein
MVGTAANSAEFLCLGISVTVNPINLAGPQIHRPDIEFLSSGDVGDNSTMTAAAARLRNFSKLLTFAGNAPWIATVMDTVLPESVTRK